MEYELAWTLWALASSSGCLEFSSTGKSFEPEGRRSGGEPVDAVVDMMMPFVIEKIS